jgi:hypothetical protein
MLSLAEAVKTGKLQEFITQEEARERGQVSRTELDAAIAAVTKAG